MAEPIVSTGDEAWHVEATLADSLRVYDLERGNGKKLCVLNGAGYQVRRDERTGIPEWWFFTRLEGVTDFEHDTSKFALLCVTLAHVIRDYNGCREIVGMISDARFYPNGVDPLEQSDGDTQAGWCDPVKSGYSPDSGHEPHRFAPYLPPERPETEKLVGRVVHVELSLQKDERTA